MVEILALMLVWWVNRHHRVMLDRVTAKINVLKTASGTETSAPSPAFNALCARLGLIAGG
jgi:hypothetical protein